MPRSLVSTLSEEVKIAKATERFNKNHLFKRYCKLVLIEFSHLNSLDRPYVKTMCACGKVTTKNLTEIVRGRGISVCKEWSQSVKDFIEWANSNGYAKGLQIDRIDNNGDYTPTNCRFVTRKVNCNNRRTSRRCVWHGEIITFKEANTRLCKGNSYLSGIEKYNNFHMLPDGVSIIPQSETVNYM